MTMFYKTGHEEKYATNLLLSVSRRKVWEDSSPKVIDILRQFLSSGYQKQRFPFRKMPHLVFGTGEIMANYVFV